MHERSKKFYADVIFFDANKNIFAANENSYKSCPSIYPPAVFAAVQSLDSKIFVNFLSWQHGFMQCMWSSLPKISSLWTKGQGKCFMPTLFIFGKA